MLFLQIFIKPFKGFYLHQQNQDLRGYLLHEIEETWERLFDMDWLKSRPKEWAGNFEDEWMQGVTPKITMNQIVKVERFIAK